MTASVLKQQPALTQLPENYLIALDDISAITLSGEEQTSYLQGQVTCDVQQLTANNLINGAHCDAKGKVYSVFRLFKRQDALWLLQPKATLAASLAALQKFGVFAKVTINEQQCHQCYALVGQQAGDMLKAQFAQVPDSMTPVVHCNNTTLIYISQLNKIARYLIIDNAKQLTQLIQKISLPIYPQSVWDLHEIMAGFPLLNQSAIGEYVPQMLNVQAINGISFTKGCYLGQETVARMQYLGRNKRALFILSGNTDTNITLDDVIEQQLGENWRSAGKLLSFYQADNGDLYLQAVLANNIEGKLRLRTSNETSIELTPIDLPYSLSQEI